LTYAVDELIVTEKEAIENTEKSIEAYEKEKKVLEEIDNELKTLNDRIDELNNKDTLTVSEEKEIDKL
jgi:hypothetical protein